MLRSTPGGTLDIGEPQVSEVGNGECPPGSCGGSGMRSGTRTIDTRGVAPVIGIVLLIGITVILAATVAAFAFGLEQESSQGQVPTVALSEDYEQATNDTLEFSHNSGETVDPQNLYVSIQGAPLCSGGDDPNGEHNVESDLAMSDSFSAGRTITVTGEGSGSVSGAVCSNNLDLSGATVHLSWRTGTGTSSTLRTWHGS